MDIKNLFSPQSRCDRATPLGPSAPLRPRSSRSRGWATTAESWRSVTTGTDSRSTTRAPRHKAYLEPFAWQTGWSPRESGWNSSRMTATTAPSSGSVTGGLISTNMAARHRCWERLGDQWQVFTLYGLEPVDPAAPVVHVSYYEADASPGGPARLPTESEWEAVAGRSRFPNA